MRSTLILIAFFFIIVASEHFRTQRTVYSFSSDQEDMTNLTREDLTPVHLTLSQLMAVDVESARLEGGKWPLSENKAVFLENSAYPGGNGNIVIYAHNWPDLFGELKHAKEGQVITLVTKNGYEWKYQIHLITEVDASQTTWVQPTETEVLTLYTCSGIFDRQRLIIQAIPIFK